MTNFSEFIYFNFAIKTNFTELKIFLNFFLILLLFLLGNFMNLSQFFHNY